MSEQYDVVIVGGGMVGLTLACALGNSPLQVAVLEANPVTTTWPENSIGLRVSAITQASRKVFDHLGAWQDMLAQRMTSYTGMHVWDASGDGAIHFDAAEAGTSSLGFIIENRVIQAALLQRADQFENIDIITPVRWQQWHNESDRLCITLDGGRQLQTRLLVGADGARSAVRVQAGIKARGWGYDQHALMAVVETEQPHRHTCWQRFLPDGPLAFLPMHDNYACVVWSTTPTQAAELIDMDEISFQAQLGEAFEYRLGKITQVCERGKFPLHMQYALDYVKPRIALVGDAAHAIHPLAGQGVNLGVLDAAALAETLLSTDARRRDIGALHNLRPYERWRKGQNVAMMLSMDGFKRLFGSRLEPVKLVRNFGLNATNHLIPVKRLLMEYAMGARGDLPRLAG